MNARVDHAEETSLFSIVTIHLDDFEGLDRTMRSLEPHLAGGGFEWILVDGGSVPGSAECDALWAKARQSAARFVSEPDEGIYHAMNKGAGMAVGEYVLYLNAGDELQSSFESGPFRHTMKSGPAMIWGNCIERYPNGQMVPVKTRSTRWAWYGMPACHPAIFFNRRVIGPAPYDTSYLIAADYDLVCRILSEGHEAVVLDEPVSVFHRGGVSDARSKLTRLEENRVRMQYFNVPGLLGVALRSFKAANRQLSKIAWLRRLWRGRV